jgi:hypothetical protein
LPLQEAAAAVAERVEGYKLQARKAQEALADKEEALAKVGGVCLHVENNPLGDELAS